MRFPSLELTPVQAGAIGAGSLVAAVGLVWLIASLVGNGDFAGDTTSTTVLPSTISSITTTTLPETTTTSTPDTTTSADTQPTTSSGVFDEVAAVEEFVEDFAAAIESGHSAFLFERLHPAVKATYAEEACLAFIDDRVLSIEDYRQEGPVIGPFDAEFGEFPITSYEVPVNFEIDGDPLEETAVFSLTEGTVRWFAECS